MNMAVSPYTNENQNSVVCIGLVSTSLYCSIPKLNLLQPADFMSYLINKQITPVHC